MFSRGRREAFSEGDVLQENIVFHALKGSKDAGTISISSGPQPGSGHIRQRTVAPSEVFRADDPNTFVYLEEARSTQDLLKASSSLSDLGLNVSTGRVVDFRSKSSLRADAVGNNEAEAVAPLIYPLHFQDGVIEWPRVGRRANPMRFGRQRANRKVALSGGCLRSGQTVFFQRAEKAHLRRRFRFARFG